MNMILIRFLLRMALWMVEAKKSCHLILGSIYVEEIDRVFIYEK
jgi:hypothetical protein